MEKPNFLEADHVSWTVPDLDAAISFYCDVFGATELFRLGPLDAADLPRGTDGRDWMESHVNVAEARLRFAMLKLTPNLKFQLVQYDKPEQRRFDLPRNCDRGGHHLGLGWMMSVRRLVIWPLTAALSSTQFTSMRARWLERPISMFSILGGTNLKSSTECLQAHLVGPSVIIHPL